MFFLAACLSFYASNSGFKGSNSLTNLIIVANALEENSDDEVNKTVTEKCYNGYKWTYCECVWCYKGTTDCTPTCPCCDE